MRTAQIAYTLCIVAAMAVSAAPAAAFGVHVPAKGAAMPSSTAMKEGGYTLSPFGYTQFCVANPAECRSRNVRRGSQIKFTPYNWSVLRRVNGAVNRSITPRRESGDRWSINAQSGDCEDYALTRRQRLIANGFPSSALVIATAKLPSGEDHAVLVAKTDRGDYVLDNLRDRVSAWNKLPYRWEKRQSSSNPRIWVSLSNEGQSVASPARKATQRYASTSRQTEIAKRSYAHKATNKPRISELTRIMLLRERRSNR